MAALSRGTLSATVPQGKKGKGEHPPCHGMHEEAEDQVHGEEHSEEESELEEEA